MAPTLSSLLSSAENGDSSAADAFFADKPESIVRMPDKSGTAIARRVKR